MGIRKAVDDSIFVSGDRDAWYGYCEQALLTKKFKKVVVDRTLGQVRGNYKPIIGTLFGDVQITLIPDGPNTRLDIQATANVDNVYSLGRSPGGKLIGMFKQGLAGLNVATPPISPQTPSDVQSTPETSHPQQTMSEELARLGHLHASKVLSDEEFTAAKAKLLDLT